MQYINHIKTQVDKINNSSPLRAAIFPQLAFALVAVEVVWVPQQYQMPQHQHHGTKLIKPRKYLKQHLSTDDLVQQNSNRAYYISSPTSEDWCIRLVFLWTLLNIYFQKCLFPNAQNISSVVQNKMKVKFSFWQSKSLGLFLKSPKTFQDYGVDRRSTTGGQSVYNHMIAKFSWMDSLPHFLTAREVHQQQMLII